MPATGSLLLASRLPDYQAAIGPRREFDPANPIVRGALLRLGISDAPKDCEDVPPDPPPDDEPPPDPDPVPDPPPPPPPPPQQRPSFLADTMNMAGMMFLRGIDMYMPDTGGADVPIDVRDYDGRFAGPSFWDGRNVASAFPGNGGWHRVVNCDPPEFMYDQWGYFSSSKPYFSPDQLQNVAFFENAQDFGRWIYIGSGRAIGVWASGGGWMVSFADVSIPLASIWFAIDYPDMPLPWV